MPWIAPYLTRWLEGSFTGPTPGMPALSRASRAVLGSRPALLMRKEWMRGIRPTSMEFPCQTAGSPSLRQQISESVLSKMKWVERSTEVSPVTKPSPFMIAAASIRLGVAKLKWSMQNFNVFSMVHPFLCVYSGRSGHFFAKDRPPFRKGGPLQRRKRDRRYGIRGYLVSTVMPCSAK